MIFRIGAALLFTAVGGVIGYSLADRLREAKNICSGIEQLFGSAEFLIGRRGDDVYGFCRSLKRDKQLSCLGFIRYLPDEYRFGENFHKQWRSAVDRGFHGDKEEKDLLLRFGDILGRSDSDAQLSAIHSFQRELDAITEQRREALLKKGRLYRGTGLLFGILEGILGL